jgi:hypothetical protein
MSAVRITAGQHALLEIGFQAKKFLPPRDGLFGATRLTPSGSPYGRSTWLRQVVEPPTNGLTGIACNVRNPINIGFS